MANTLTTKNILLIGSVEHGKSTLKNALSDVFYTRYRLGKEIRIRDIDQPSYIYSDPPLEIVIDDCCYRFIDIPSNNQIEDYIYNHAKEIDTAIVVCSLCHGVQSETLHQTDLCNVNGITIACAYVSNSHEYFDENLCEFVHDEIQTMIGSRGNPYTRKLTGEFSERGCSTAIKNCPILFGDSKLAMEEPFGEYGDILVRLVHYVKVALFGTEI